MGRVFTLFGPVNSIKKIRKTWFIESSSELSFYQTEVVFPAKSSHTPQVYEPEHIVATIAIYVCGLERNVSDETKISLDLEHIT